MVFGRLTVLKKDGMRQCGKTKLNLTFWECQCSCGNKIVVRHGHLTSSKYKTKSCGCAGKERLTKHGLSRRKDYFKYLLSDPTRRLKLNTSVAVRRALKSRYINKNKESAWDYLPFTATQLKDHLEKLWESWMNWDNYGGRLNEPRKTWHLDHIVPQNNFNFTSMNDPQFIECWSLSNLRPLDKHENRKKWYY